jgi:predicted Holliday junction resolvase-like endonuclease
METMYFFLGVLTVVAAIVAGVITWGLLKIKNQQRSIEILQQRLDEMPRQFYDETRNITQTYDRRIEDVWGGFRDIRNEIVDISKSDVELSKSYTDSRIDKLIDTYFDMVGAKKQIIK